MHFEDLNWMGIENYLQEDTRVILVLGACEQHGYLSLLTDVKIPMALAEAASKETDVIVAPPLNFGCSPYFLDFPGTVSLRLETYLNVVGDVLRSLYGAGFRQVLILNGHGGNTSVMTYLVELVNELPDLDLRWYAWWTSESVATICEKHDLIGEHASWMEAFDFTIVSDLPEAEKPQVDTKNAILGKDANRKVYGDGMFGGTYQADPAVMREMFDACLADIRVLLKFE